MSETKPDLTSNGGNVLSFNPFPSLKKLKMPQLLLQALSYSQWQAYIKEGLP